MQKGNKAKVALTAAALTALLYVLAGAGCSKQEGAIGGAVGGGVLGGAIGGAAKGSTGAGVGIAIGAVSGALLGAAVSDDECCSSCKDCHDDEDED